MACFRNICGWMWSVYYGEETDSCPQPCQTISSLGDLPDPNTCDFVYLSEITTDPATSTGILNSAYYKHDGVDWVQVAGVSAPYLAVFGNQEFQTVFDLTLAAGWTATVYGDFYDTSGQYPVPFPASSIGITFTETETECVYDLGEVGVSCAVACETIHDLAELPNPAVCDFVYYEPINEVQNNTYYIYSGGAWQPIYEITDIVYNGNTEITSITITILSGWSLSVDGFTWYDADGIYDTTGLSGQTIYLRNDANLCQYQGQTFSCPLACETISDLDNLPNPTVCGFVFYQPMGDMINHTYYIYIGGVWQPIYEVTNVVQSDTFEVTSITFTILAGWSLSIDGSTWYNTGGTYDTTGLGGDTITIRNDASSCEYTGQTFLYVTSGIMSDPDLSDFSGWTFVGGNISLVEPYWIGLYAPSVYTNLNTPITNPDSGSYFILNKAGNIAPPDLEFENSLSEPVPMSFAVYYPVCLQTTFTVSDPSLATPTDTIAFNVPGFGDYGGCPDLADAGINAFLSAQRFNTVAAINSVFVTLNGNDVTITLIDAFNYSPYGVNVDDNGSPVSGTFTEIPCP